VTADRKSSERPADAPTPDEVDRAAAIDDFFGGFVETLPDSATSPSCDDSPLPGSLDLLLLLRQAAARGVDPPAKQPEAIGRYRILRLAGRGGFSFVWEAFDPLLRRRVAVKACTPDALVSPSVRRRFRREAELASRLVHPHIVTIHEVGEADGLEFITEEFCEGGSLAEWLAQNPGPVPPRVAARIAQAVAHAAAYAHAGGVVHRDIKPANVMLVPVDGHDAAACIIPPHAATESTASQPGMTVKLGDFGLGWQHVADEGEDPLTQLTTDGARLGTPAWMAPEQIDRSFGDVGPATDVHAIGLLLDRMLTGRPLRGGKTDVETYREVLLDEPAPADRVNRAVSPDLAAICLTCLAKRPADRYESAAAVAKDLGRWLDGRPTQARPLSPAGRLARTVARRPVVAGLVAAAFLATCVAGWAALERSREQLKGTAQQEEIRRQNAAAELRRGFDSLQAANVAGALAQIEKTRSIDPGLADSLAARWLERRLRGEQEILLKVRPDGGAGNRADLYCLAVSPDGRTAVVGAADGSLRLLRDVDGQPRIDVIPAHDEINDVCFSPDGRLIASVGQDGRLRWWSVGAPTSLAGEAPPTECPLYGVAFAADNTSLYYGGEDRILRRVDLAADRPPEEIHRFVAAEGDSPEIEAIVRAGDVVVVACGGMLAAFDADESRMLWSRQRDELYRKGNVFHALAASPAGDRIAAGGSDREPTIWEASSGMLLASLPVHPNWIQACRFSPDGKVVATACRDGVIRVFDAATGSLLEKLVGHAGRVWDVDFEPEGRLLTTGADGTVRRWDRADASPAAVLRDMPVPGPGIKMVREVIGSSESSAPCRLIAVREAGPPLVVAIDTGETSECAAADRPCLYSAAVDRLRQRVAFGFMSETADPNPLVLPLQGGSSVPLAAVPAGDRVGPYVCWTPSGSLITNSHQGRILAWSPSLAHVVKVADAELPSTRVEAAPVGPSRIAVAGRSGIILPLDKTVRAAAAPIRLQEVNDMISSLAWSPDGTSLACGLRNGSVHVFDAATGRMTGTLAPHERQIFDIGWSPDGRVIITADAECLRISDAATLSTYDDLRPGWQIETMYAAADGRFIAIGGFASTPNPDERGRLAILDLDPR
jgi:eukaryotic-like serine/threonine-protein kinase